MQINWKSTLRRWVRPGAFFAAAAIALLFGLAERANARINRIVISKVQSPMFGGASFGSAGQYEEIAGRAFGEVDPNDRRNAVIADIGLAPRNAKGMVEYSMDIWLL